MEWLKHFEAKWEEGFKALDKIGEAFKDVPDEELERETERAIAAVRKKNRGQRTVPTATQ